MASAVARAYLGVWGLSPQWGPGARPLVRGSGGEAPLKLTTFLHSRYIFLVSGDSFNQRKVVNISI